MDIRAQVTSSICPITDSQSTFHLFQNKSLTLSMWQWNQSLWLAWRLVELGCGLQEALAQQFFKSVWSHLSSFSNESYIRPQYKILIKVELFWSKQEREKNWVKSLILQERWFRFREGLFTKEVNKETMNKTYIVWVSIQTLFPVNYDQPRTGIWQEESWIT